MVRPSTLRSLRRIGLCLLVVGIFTVLLNHFTPIGSVTSQDTQYAYGDSGLPRPDKKHKGSKKKKHKAHTADGKHRVAIVTFTTHETSYTQLSLKNKDAYAKKHGYDFIVDYEGEEPMGLMWHKFVMLENVIMAGKHDWVWWIDFDSLITNSTIELSDIIDESLANNTKPDKVDFLVTADCFQLNAGSMLVRSRQSSIDFLNKVRGYGEQNRDLSEQDCIRDVINKSTDKEKEQVFWIPQWKINAFPEEIRCWDESDRGWERGVFAVHFAGAWAHVKEEDPTGYLMRKYEGEIV